MASKNHIDQPRQRLTVGHSPKLRVSSAGLLRAVYRVGIAIVAGCVISAALNFPRSHDLPLTGKEIEETRQFYTNAYKRTTETKSEAEVQYMAKYEAIAEYVSHRNEIKNQIGEFVRD